MSDKTKYPLKQPVSFGGENVTELAFRRPKARDLRPLPMGELKAGDLLDLAARLAEVPPSLLDELEAEDAMAVMALVGGFTDASRKTG